MKKLIILTAIATTILVSCSNEDPSGDNNRNLLMIKVAGIETKSIKSTFVDNDSIKVFITGTSYTPTLTTYKYNSTNNSWGVNSLSNDIELSSNDATVYAYYPTTLTAPDLSNSGTLPITIPAVDDMATSGTTDVLWATPATQVKNTGTSNLATLHFNHAVAKISFIIVKDATYPSDVTMGAIDTISLTSSGSKIVNSGTVNIATGLFTAGSPRIGSVLYIASNTTHINQTGSNAVTAYALIAPVNYTSGDFVLKMKIDGKWMTVSNFLASPNWSAANTNYIYTITVNPTSLVVSNLSSINDWNPSTTIGGITAE